jgi:hypothetical protein
MIDTELLTQYSEDHYNEYGYYPTLTPETIDDIILYRIYA